MRVIWAAVGAVLPVALLGGVSLALTTPPDPARAASVRTERVWSDDELDEPVHFGPSVDPVVLGATMPDRPALPPPPQDARAFEPEPAREIFYGDTSRRAVALTFDDGPSRENTPRILDVLAKHDVQATFFVLGSRVDKMPDLVERIDADGHELGNHTWSHPSMRSLWPSAMREELESTNTRIEEITRKRPTMVRPPFGRYPPSALPLFGELGLDAVLWSVDSLDWDTDDSLAIARTVVRRATPGSIVLLHDRTAATVHALPEIIRGLRERGFDIVPVSTLIDSAPSREDAHAAMQDRP